MESRQALIINFITFLKTFITFLFWSTFFYLFFNNFFIAINSPRESLEILETFESDIFFGCYFNVYFFLNLTLIKNATR
jgi:hypothetical protein